MNLSKNKKSVILVIDIGTTFLKIGFFDLKANPVNDFQFKIPHTLKIDKVGKNEFDPIELSLLIEKCIDDILIKSDRKHEILSVAVDSMASTFLGLDKDKNPVTNVFTYADTRAKIQMEKIKEEIDVEEVYDRTGCPIHTAYVPAKVRWLNSEFPELYRKIEYWCDFSTYLYTRWFYDQDVPCSYSIASWSGLFNRYNLKWDEELLRHIGINQNKLPKLKPYSSFLMNLGSDFFKRWDILKNIPFFLPIGDGAASHIGSGCTSANHISLSIGTTGAMRVLLNSFNKRIPKGLWAYNLGKDDTLLGGSFSEGGNVLMWLMNNLSLPEQSKIEDYLKNVSYDNHALNVLPFIAGERSLGWSFDGSLLISGIGLSTSKFDIYQACLEAISYRFGLVADKLLPSLENNCEILVSGGAIQSSEYWLQLMSDVLQIPVNLSNISENTSKGTSILALESLNIWDSWNYIPSKIVKKYYPDSNKASLLREAMGRQKDLYDKFFTY